MISLFLGFASSAHLLRFHLTSSSEVSILAQSCLIWLFPLSILSLLWGFLLGGRFGLLVLTCKGSNLLQPHHILLHQDPRDEGTHLQIASSRIPSKFGWPFPGWSSVHTCRSGGFLYSRDIRSPPAFLLHPPVQMCNPHDLCSCWSFAKPSY